MKDEEIRDEAQEYLWDPSSTPDPLVQRLERTLAKHRYPRPPDREFNWMPLKAVAAALIAKGCAFIDAPVGRAPSNAADGTLMFMVGGAPEDFDLAKAYLDAMGTDIHHCGPVGTGIAMKLVLNLLGQSTCQLSAEVMALGLKMGLSMETLHPILTGGIGRNGFVADYWPTKVLRGDTEPGFAIRLSAKDLRLAAVMAEEAGAPIPTGAAAAAAVNRAAETHGELDVSGMLTVACENAGVKSTFG